MQTFMTSPPRVAKNVVVLNLVHVAIVLLAIPALESVCAKKTSRAEDVENASQASSTWIKRTNTVAHHASVMDIHLSV